MKNKKRNIRILFPITFILLSCSNAEESQISKQENLGFEDTPNSETKKISIETKNMPDQLDLMKSLKARLEENEFNIEEQEVTYLPGFSNCEDNSTIQME